jgi:hypothetical protein
MPKTTSPHVTLNALDTTPPAMQDHKGWRELADRLRANLAN